MLSKEEQEQLKTKIKNRIMIRCDYCGKKKLKRYFSYIGTYLGNICMDCQEQDNY